MNVDPPFVRVQLAMEDVSVLLQREYGLKPQREYGLKPQGKKMCPMFDGIRGSPINGSSKFGAPLKVGVHTRPIRIEFDVDELIRYIKPRKSVSQPGRTCDEQPLPGSGSSCSVISGYSSGPGIQHQPMPLVVVKDLCEEELPNKVLESKLFPQPEPAQKAPEVDSISGSLNKSPVSNVIESWITVEEIKLVTKLTMTPPPVRPPPGLPGDVKTHSKTGFSPAEDKHVFDESPKEYGEQKSKAEDDHEDEQKKHGAEGIKDEAPDSTKKPMNHHRSSEEGPDNWTSELLELRNAGSGLRERENSETRGVSQQRDQETQARQTLEDKLQRDLAAQKEQEEKQRIGEVMDSKIKRWKTGKEGNIRPLHCNTCCGRIADGKRFHS